MRGGREEGEKGGEEAKKWRRRERGGRKEVEKRGESNFPSL